jgi:ATP-binding cassette subfamily F protein uup
MALLQLRNITLRYSAAALLDGADLQLEARERVCLLGRNGAGKTSLMRLLTGEEQPNAGEIIRPPAAIMTRLDQEIPPDVEGSVFDVLHSGLRADRHEEEWESDVRLEELAEAMKLPTNARFSSLSGGLKRRVLLGRALAAQPDLLLLDEPTNHLDLDSILWLEQFLTTRPVTLFFVTHDRTFLRNVATRIVELDRGKLTSWACDYDTFLVRKAAWLEAEEKQWAAFDKKLAQEEVWLRQGVKARRTRNEGRVRALEKMRAERRQRRERTGTVRMELQEGQTSGQKVIDVDQLSFTYGEATVIQEFTTTIWRGDKIGIIGPNGSGKTTLLRLLLGQLQPTRGTVALGTNLQVIYLDQLRGQIDGEKTLAQNVAGSAETVTFAGRAKHIHGYLQDFLFAPEQVRMPAKRLSGGERNRLLLARLFLQPGNVLVLDEPTNDLDAETLELLEELLVETSMTLLVVSHDRAFLDNIVTSTLVIEDGGRVTEVLGGYSDWLKLQAARDLAPASAPPTMSSAPAPIRGKSAKPRKFLNREQRELEELPARIAELEQRHESLAARLADPALYTQSPEVLPGLEAELQTVELATRSAYARWEELESLKKEIEATAD